jgi:hypothetical protein
MSVLVPMDGVLGSVAKVADRDPAAAAMLVQLGMFEALTEQIEAVRTPMTKAVLRNMDQVAKSARRQLERTVVAKGEAPDGYAQALDVIDDFVAKGLLGTLIGGTLAAFNREHPRDQKGRFVTYRAGQTGLPKAASMGEQQSHQTTELAIHRDRMKQAKLIDDDTLVHVGTRRRFTDPRTGVQEAEDTVRYIPMKAKDIERWSEKNKDNELPTELQIRRSNLKDVPPSQLAAIDLAQLATGGDFMAARKLTRGVFDDEGNPKKFGDAEARNWHGATEGTNRQTYRRVKTLGQGLSAGTPAGHPLNTVGNLAQLMGDIGPEAEKVLGPGIRRTAYRYRGTERRPEKDLYEAVGRATKWMNDYNDVGTAADEFGRTRSEVAASNLARAAADDPKARHAGDYAAKIAGTYATQSLTDDERDLAARGGVAVASLLGYGHGDRTRSRLPDMELTELSLASGEVPPSEGVIIDADGHVVSQAVGYNGDHYLPFDLRNLGRLHGGQYVRTRASGGPTTEDIYTGLVTGTRQIQVVSNSGVFTMEFDPDLRGVRRFNDKVSRMVERYGSMLAAIHDPESELFENDLPQATMRKLRTEASMEARSQDDYQKRLGNKIREARWRAETDSASWEEIDQQAREAAEEEIAGIRGERVSPAQKESMIEEIKNDYIDNRTPSVRKLKLDGSGYFRAMRALQQEFPYYLRKVDFQPLPKWLQGRGLRTMGYGSGAPSDKAYVAPGQTNTAAAMVGGFRSARQVRTGHEVRHLARAQATYGSTRRPLPKTTSEPEQNAPATPGTQDTPSTARNGASGASDPKKVDEKALVASRLTSAMHPIATRVANYQLGGLPDPKDSDEVVLREMPKHFYAHRIISKEGLSKGPGREGEALTEWLLGQDDVHRSAFLQGLDEYIEHPDIKQQAEEPVRNEFKKHLERLKDAETMRFPYAADPKEGNPEESAPAVPKPFKLPVETPGEDAKEEEWIRQIHRLDADYASELGKDTFSSEVTNLSGKSPKDRFEYVRDLHKEMNDKRMAGRDYEPQRVDLIAAHRAWTFVQARQKAKQLRELIGSDVDPKDLSKADSSPPDGDPFLLRLRAELDQMIADGLVAPG